MASQSTSQRSEVPAFLKRHGRMTWWIALSFGLLLLHAACIAALGSQEKEPLYSALFLLAEGAACVIACYGAGRRSGPVGRYFWRNWQVCVPVRVCWTIYCSSFQPCRWE